MEMILHTHLSKNHHATSSISYYVKYIVKYAPISDDGQVGRNVYRKSDPAF